MQSAGATIYVASMWWRIFMSDIYNMFVLFLSHTDTTQHTPMHKCVTTIHLIFDFWRTIFQLLYIF